MLYHWYELNHLAAGSLRNAIALNHAAVLSLSNPLSKSYWTQCATASREVFDRALRRYRRPEFNIQTTAIDAATVPVSQHVIRRWPFCQLLEFRCAVPQDQLSQRPNLLIVAPMSGHFSSLLQGTVEALLPTFNVFITDWQDAREVPLSDGHFDLDDYIDYLIDSMRYFSGDVHVYAVSQSAVPALASVASLSQQGSDHVPRSMILTAAPIDTRVNPTAVNYGLEALAGTSGTHALLHTIPWPNPGHGRQVYPGFLHLAFLMALNPAYHARTHHAFASNLMTGNDEAAAGHRNFYDTYFSVMDLTAEFFLQTLDTVFLRRDLPCGTMRYRDLLIEPRAIEQTALMTIEGGRDDISGVGQCSAAHALCSGLHDDRKVSLLFQGRRALWRFQRPQLQNPDFAATRKVCFRQRCAQFRLSRACAAPRLARPVPKNG